VTRRGRLIAIACGAILATAGCGLFSSDIVDGWAVGDRIVECTDRSDEPECGPYLEPGLTALGGAPAGSAVTLHKEGSYAGGSRVTRLAGPITVVVVTGVDGTRRAVGVGCRLVLTGQIPTCDVVPPPTF
jgi:hypothetical protein